MVFDGTDLVLRSVARLGRLALQPALKLLHVAVVVRQPWVLKVEVDE